MYLHLIIGTSFLPHPLRNRIVLKSEKYKQVLKKFQKLSFCFSCGEWERAGGFLEKFNVWPEAGYSTVSLVLSRLTEPYDTPRLWKPDAWVTLQIQLLVCSLFPSGSRTIVAIVCTYWIPTLGEAAELEGDSAWTAQNGGEES